MTKSETTSCQRKKYYDSYADIKILKQISPPLFTSASLSEHDCLAHEPGDRSVRKNIRDAFNLAPKQKQLFLFYKIN